MSDDATITAAELDWVLGYHGLRQLRAADLIGEIEANRDSAHYEMGAYLDPEDNIWVFSRTVDGSPFWLRPGREGPFEFAVPRRPLRRLVPEGPDCGQERKP